mmetsp:Transcript_22203/g.54325  ORF Transcript_22203/g.54325 Transcript_22203/m.54325 type:complete len:228 (-) Transcript_22203:343-1026(-)
MQFSGIFDPIGEYKDASFVLLLALPFVLADFVQEFQKLPQFLVIAGDYDILGNRRGNKYFGVRLIRLDSQRISEPITCEIPQPFRKGRAAQHGLDSIQVKAPSDLLDLFLQSHGQQLVHLIQDEVGHAIRPDLFLLNAMLQAPRGCDHDAHGAVLAGALGRRGGHCCPSNGVQAAHFHDVAEGQRRPLNLLGELSRGFQDEHSRFYPNLLRAVHLGRCHLDVPDSGQ